MAASIQSGKIILNFGWKGPNKSDGGWSQGGLDVSVVDLKFKDAKTEISVHIPDEISPSKVQRLPFTLRKYGEKEWELNDHKFKPLLKETHPESLQVTVEQIHNLTIKAGIFEKSPYQGNAIMDSSGKITRETRILRTDSDVKLEIPKELEIGQTYCLLVTSNDLFPIKARLVKENKSSTKDDEAQFILDQTELYEILGPLLHPLMGIKVMEFGMKLMTISSNSTPNINSLLGDKTLGIQAIKAEIGKLEKSALKELMIKIRASKIECQNKPLQRDALEKEGVKACFNAIGPEGLANIMRSNLEALIQGNIPSEMKLLIDDIAKRFKEICLKNVK